MDNVDPRHEFAPRRRIRIPRLLIPLVLALVGACESGPTSSLGEEGFVVIITSTTLAPGVSPGAPWTISVDELSGTVGGDTTIAVAPVDTAVLTLPIATYITTLQGLPLPCTVRNPVQEALVPQRGTTWTVRYRVACSAPLVVETSTAGPPGFRDEDLVYQVRQVGGNAFGGGLSANDTARVDGVDPGDYVVELRHVNDNCIVTSAGGDRQEVTVQPPRTTVASFGLICSDPQFRPTLLKFGARLRDGFSVIFLEATDPGSGGQVTGPDISRFRWDLTDCNGFSVRENGAVWRQGLDFLPATRGQDTVRAVGVFFAEELVPSERLCTSLLVTDRDGNTTEIAEVEVGEPVGRDPRVRGFRATLEKPEEAPFLSFELDASDPDGDLAGGYLHLDYEDGTFFEPDGVDEVVIPSVVGFPGTDVPIVDLRGLDLPLEGLRSVTVFVVDREGNFTRFTDELP